MRTRESMTPDIIWYNWSLLFSYNLSSYVEYILIILFLSILLKLKTNL